MPQIELQALLSGVLIPILIVIMSVFTRRNIIEERQGLRDWVIGLDLVMISFSFSAAMLLEGIWSAIVFAGNPALDRWKYLVFFLALILSIGFRDAVVGQYKKHMRGNPANAANVQAPLPFFMMLWINFLGATPLALVISVLLS